MPGGLRGPSCISLKSSGSLQRLWRTATERTAPATREERENLEEEFADVLAWLATLANINGVDLADTLVKYTDPDRVQGIKE